jgi:hypothetical protein
MFSNAKPEDQRLRLAVELLNNHAPCFGASHDGEGVISGGGLVMEEVPGPVADALADALVAAARFVQRSFDEE